MTNASLFLESCCKLVGHACYGCPLLHRGPAVCTYSAAAFDGEGISSLRCCLSAFLLSTPPPHRLCPTLSPGFLNNSSWTMSRRSCLILSRGGGRGVQDSGWKTDTSDGLCACSRMSPSSQSLVPVSIVSSFLWV